MALQAQVQSSPVEEFNVTTARYQACGSDFGTCVLDEEARSSTRSPSFMCQLLPGSRPELVALQAKLQSSSVEQLNVATAGYQACGSDFGTCVLHEEARSFTCSPLIHVPAAAGFEA